MEPQPSYQKYREAILARDDFKCCYCGGVANLVVDHVIAERRGGPNRLQNFAAACAPCNLSKKSKYWRFWYAGQFRSYSFKRERFIDARLGDLNWELRMVRAVSSLSRYVSFANEILFWCKGLEGIKWRVPEEELEEMSKQLGPKMGKDHDLYFKLLRTNTLIGHVFEIGFETWPEYEEVAGQGSFPATYIKGQGLLEKSGLSFELTKYTETFNKSYSHPMRPRGEFEILVRFSQLKKSLHNYLENINSG